MEDNNDWNADYEDMDLDEGDDSNDNEEEEESEVHVDSSNQNYKVITKESLPDAQSEDLRKVVEFLAVQTRQARTLLIHYRWNVENLFCALAERGTDSVFHEAGLTPPTSNSIVRPPDDGDDTNTNPLATRLFRCGTCLEDIFVSASTQMDCAHAFCNNCWTQYFILKIKEGLSKRLTCMEHQCNAICDEDKIRKLVAVQDSEAVELYNRFLQESYIEDNSNVKWCPSVPHCGNAIQLTSENVYCEIECLCGQEFCFNCVHERHSPCSCVMWAMWSDKCKDESETMNYLTVHTKNCPKCRKMVEKNGGCNHVTCVCGQSFCWLCSAQTGESHNYDNIFGHTCGLFEEDKLNALARAKRDLERYNHYHSRWKGHINSLNIEKEYQQKIVEPIILAMQSSRYVETLRSDFEWVKVAFERLFQARRGLAYSFVFAYFMFGQDLFEKEMISEEQQNVMNKGLFEDQQQQLEKMVEMLSKCLETLQSPILDHACLKNIRFHVIDSTGIVNRLYRRMYEVIENDLLGSLQCSTHHIAPFRARVEENQTWCPTVN